jgi:hypothetical protein
VLRRTEAGQAPLGLGHVGAAHPDAVAGDEDAGR